MQETLLLDLENINKVVNKLKAVIKKDCVVLLKGDLASGKTTLVKNLLKVMEVMI